MRVTPILGPDVGGVGPAGQYYYDAGQPGESPQPGVTFWTSDGLKATYAVNGDAALTANARVNLAAGTFVATASGTGTYVAPVAVPAGEPFVALEYRA